AAHAAPATARARREPAGFEGRGALRTRQGAALPQRQTREAGGGRHGLSQREELHPRIPAVDGRLAGGVSGRSGDVNGVWVWERAPAAVERECFAVRIQPVDATHWLNISVGV